MPVGADITPDVLDVINQNQRLVGLPTFSSALAYVPPPVKAPSLGSEGRPPGLAGPLGVPGLGSKGPQGFFVKGRPWINAVLKGIGAPATRENVRFLDAWARAEGGGGYAGSGSTTFNWLNTTRDAPGATQFNTVGVENFPNFQTGVNATIEALRNGYYPQIVAGLRSGRMSAQQLASISHELSTWGTGSGVLRVLGSEGQPSQYPTVSVGGHQYVNPIPPGSVRNRTDQGVDFQAPVGAPIRAIGDAQVVSISSDPGGFGQMITYRLLSGPLKGRYLYVGHTVPIVRAGQRVRAGQAVSVARQPSGSSGPPGWVEYGYASGPSLTQAHALGQTGAGDANTLSGKQFLSLLRELGIR